MRQARPFTPTTPTAPAVMVAGRPLPPAEHYALLAIVACRRLYRYGNHFRLDAPDERGAYHLVALGPVLALDAAGLVRLFARKRVPGSIGFVEDTACGLALARCYGWRTVGREWNEMPLDVMRPADAA